MHQIPSLSSQNCGHGFKLVGKSLGRVDFDIECKNISVSADMGGGGDSVYQIVRDTEKCFVLAYFQPLTGSKICQNKNIAIFIKNALKTSKVYSFFRFRLYSTICSVSLQVSLK